MLEKFVFHIVLVSASSRALMMRVAMPNGDLVWMPMPLGIASAPSEIEEDRIAQAIFQQTGNVAARLSGDLWHGEIVGNVARSPTRLVGRFILAHCATELISRAGWTEEEYATIHDVRWWSGKELYTTSEVIWPAVAQRFLPEVLDGRLPTHSQMIHLA